MVKIRERGYPEEPPLVVEMYHIGEDGYAPGLYPYDLELGVMRPPWPPDFWPETGHLLMQPTLNPYSPSFDTVRFFDPIRWDEVLEEWVSNEQAAWDFYYAMLGQPYRMISRCRYCFPAGHRFLTI